MERKTAWVIGRTAAHGKQKKKRERTNPEIPAADQEVRIEKLLGAQTDMLQAQIDKKQAQIEVVEAMRSERKRTNLSADDKEFLETKGINPEIPAADQEVRIEKLLDKLEKDEVRAQTDMLQAQIDKKQAQIDKTQAQIKVVKAMRSEGKRTNLSADDRVFLETEGINPEIPAADQAVRIDKLEKDEVRAQTDLLQAQIDKKQAQMDKTQAQINVVKAMRSEATRKELSADDRVFLETEGINPEIPAADQEVRIEKLLDKLEKEKPATAMETLLEAEGLTTAVPAVTPCDVIAKELSERDKDIEAVTDYLCDVRDKSPLVYEDQGGGQLRTELFLVYAVMGGGKTAFLKKIAAQHAVKSDGVGAGIFMSYNESTSLVSGVTGSDELRCFAVQLLLHYEVPAEVAKRVKSLDAALAFMRAAMDLPGSAPLTICVDEIAVLDKQKAAGHDPAQRTISALMGYQDSLTNKGTHGRVYFIFSSLISSYADSPPGAGWGGRRIKRHGLKNLSMDAAAALLSEEAREMIAENPPVAVLFAALGGHPRAVVEGFKPRVPDSLSVNTDVARVELLRKIFNACKFEQGMDLEMLSTAVRNWVADEGQDDKARLAGWVQKNSEGAEFLTALGLRYYSESKHSAVVREVLQKVYQADLAVSDSQEKNVEILLAHFEVVRKLCLDGAAGSTVKEFFFGGTCVTNFQHTRLYWVDAGASPVSYVPRFKKKAKNEKKEEVKEDATSKDSFSEVVVSRLLRGETVISKLQNEPGVGYLCPFFKRKPSDTTPYEKKDLLVAKVQVKFANKLRTTWQALTKKVQEATATTELRNAGVESFTVLYTIFDNVPPKKNMLKDVVYYNRAGMEKYTERLGPLRFHFEKRDRPYEWERKNRESKPTKTVLRSWTPRWDTPRAPALQPWLPPQLPLARQPINLLMLRRARFAAKLLV